MTMSLPDVPERWERGAFGAWFAGRPGRVVAFLIAAALVSIACLSIGLSAGVRPLTFGGVAGAIVSAIEALRYVRGPRREDRPTR
jgi:hypothetical protein